MMGKSPEIEIVGRGGEQRVTNLLEPVTVRMIRSEDAVLLEQFGEHLSASSRYQRFFSPRGFLPGEVERLTSIDPTREMALIAIVQTTLGSEMIGVVRYVLDPNTQGAEMAIVLADRWQGKGLGHRLLAMLLDLAAERDVRFVDGMVLSTNLAMQHLALSLGFRLHHLKGNPGVLQIRKDLQLAH